LVFLIHTEHTHPYIRHFGFPAKLQTDVRTVTNALTSFLL